MLNKFKNIFNSEKVSTISFFSSIILSIIIAVIIYIWIDKYNLHLANNLTATVAVIASLPTAYLWIVRERKKEKEIELKKEDVLQSKINELNKNYVDVINQFYTEKTFLPGTFAIVSLIDSWDTLEDDSKKNEKLVKLKKRQLLSILFSEFINKKENKAFHRIVSKLIIEYSKKGLGVVDYWPAYDFSGINISRGNLSNAFLYNVNLYNSKLIETTIVNSNLKRAILIKSNLLRSDLTNTQLNNAKLDDAILNKSRLIKTKLSGASLEKTKLNRANLTDAVLIKAYLREAELEGALLIRANFSEADLIEANLRDSNLSKANLLGASLDGAILTNASFESAIVGLEQYKIIKHSDCGNKNVKNKEELDRQLEEKNKKSSVK